MKMEKVFYAEVRKKKDYLKVYKIAYNCGFTFEDPERILKRLITKKPYKSLIYVDTEKKLFWLVGGITVCAAICTAHQGEILTADNLENILLKKKD